MADSFGSMITSNASINTAENTRKAYEEYIMKRAQECLAVDKIELNKRAIDAGVKARTVIKDMEKKLENELNAYLAENMSYIIDNKYELLHISELEAKSDQRGYMTGQIVHEIQRVVVFKRGK